MKKKLITAACAIFLTIGVANAGAQIVVRIGPPPVRHEVIPPRPRAHRDWVWVGGFHRWDGHTYVWVPGHYEAPPHPHAHWVPGRWAHRHGGWVWIEGRWR